MTSSLKKISSISFFCPALNEEEALVRLIPRVREVLSSCADAFEIIIIDDGSTDQTPVIAQAFAAADPRIRVIRHDTNKGYGVSLAEGFRSAHYDWVMYTDGDYQYDVEDIVPHLSLLQTHDILSGYVTYKATSLSRYVQSKVYNVLIRALFGVKMKDINCAMKIYSRRVIADIDMASKGFFIDAEMLIRARRKGYRIAQYPVTHLPRSTGVATGSHPLLVLQTITEMLRFRCGLL